MKGATHAMKKFFGYTSFQLALEAVALAAFAAGEVYLLIRWNTLPQLLPLGYTLGGQVTEWGDASLLRGLGMASLLLYALITVISLMPSTWRRKLQGDEVNRELVQRIMRTQLIGAKAILAGAVTYLIVCTAQGRELAGFFFGGVLGAILAVVICCRVLMARGSSALFRRQGDELVAQAKALRQARERAAGSAQGEEQDGKGREL